MKWRILSPVVSYSRKLHHPHQYPKAKVSSELTHCKFLPLLVSLSSHNLFCIEISLCYYHVTDLICHKLVEHFSWGARDIKVWTHVLLKRLDGYSHQT